MAVPRTWSGRERLAGAACASAPRTRQLTRQLTRLAPLAHSAITRCSSRTPSVSAAGPGCRMIDDFTSCSSPSRTAGTSCQPGRAATARRVELLAAPRAEDQVRRAPRRLERIGEDAVLAERAQRAAPERCRRRPRCRSAPRPSGCTRSAARPIPRSRRAAAERKPRPRVRISSSPASSCSASCARLRLATDHARRACGSCAGSPPTLRWLKTCTSMPWRTSCGRDVRLQVGEAEHEVRLAARRSGRSSRW